MSLDSFEMKFLSDLIAIRSVGGDPDGELPYGSAPYGALEFFLDTAKECGMRTGIIDNRVGYAEIGPEASDKLAGIVCHLDVVPEGTGWNTDPFTLTLTEDGYLCGRGITDDKGPAAASFFAMRRLLASGAELKTRIRLILGTDEERTCSCVECYAEKGEIPAFAITPDAEFPVIYAEKGILNVKVYSERPSQITAFAGHATNMVPAAAEAEIDGKKLEASGVPAHASRPELGVNAIFELVKSLGEDDLSLSPVLSYIRNELAERSASEYTGCAVTDDSGKITGNPSVLRADTDGESITIDIRYPVTASKDDILAHFAQEAEVYGLKVSETNHMAPLYKEKDTPEIRMLTTVWDKYKDRYDGFKDEYKGMYKEPLAIGGGTYARHMPNTIAFGMQAPWQQDQCHQANERRKLTDFEADIDILTEAITGLTELV
ncbi:MAG: Sapep family Mn(2+)-dependent dipeptidase [Clostridiales bacterium]|nr:Sapep family Mn(2+)-dependent dipeptidase [Clostridiales bacterium]